MISADKEVRICELLRNSTLSHRKIAAIVRVNRGIVHNISAGRRPGDLTRQCEAKSKAKKDDRTVRLVAPYECPGCRRQVVFRPCQICNTRDAIRNDRVLRRPDPADDPDLALRLSPEVAEAAEKVRLEGFLDCYGRLHPPWSEGETERRTLGVA